MIYLGKFCCVCLDVGQKLEKIILIQENKTTYYDKLLTLIPEMSINDIKQIAFICYDCKKCTDRMFNFRTTCLRNNGRLQKYISQLFLYKNDTDRVSVRLCTDEEKISDDPEECNGITHMNFIQFKDNLVIECDGEVIEECVKKEVLDDDVDCYQLGSAGGNDGSINLEMIKDNYDSTSEINENVMNLKDRSNNIQIDISEHIKKETFDDNFISNYEPEFENGSINNEINATFEINVNKTDTGLEDPLEKISNIEAYQNANINNDEISSLHTKLNINDCIKNETSYESFDDNVDIISETFVNVIESTKSNTDENNMKDFSSCHSEDDSNTQTHLSEENTWDKPYRCRICDKSFMKSYNLKRHNRLHTGEKLYSCQICNKYYIESHSLKIHYRIHTGEKPYKCEQCEKSFIHLSSFKKHQLAHSGVKAYRCELCEKSFITSYGLRNHTLVHTGEKSYKCDICNKSFSLSSNFTKHTRIHTGEKPFKCNTCNKLFSSRNGYKRHQKLHTGEKPYKCEICDKSFIESNKLKKHKRLHTGEEPYICEICNKSFNELHIFNKHNLTHTGERPHQCDVCDKAFSLSSNLIEHVRIHTGERPYKCEVCDKRFIASNKLKRHYRTHTGEKNS